MDSKKTVLILGLLAMALLISSQVSARDLTEKSTNTKEEIVGKLNEVNDTKYGAEPYGYGHGYRLGGHRGGHRGGRHGRHGGRHGGHSDISDHGN